MDVSDIPSLEESRRLDKRTQPKDHRRATAPEVPTEVERGRRRGVGNLWAFLRLATYLATGRAFRTVLSPAVFFASASITLLGRAPVQTGYIGNRLDREHG